METIEPSREVIKAILTGFADPKGIAEVFDVLYPGRTVDFVDAVGMGPHADELMLCHVEAFFKEVQNPASPHYRFKSVTAHVRKYVTTFDVHASGPDVLKFICGFGHELETFAAPLGERLLVTSMIRLTTVRLLRNAAAMRHPQHAVPPAVMVRKINNIWKAGNQVEMLGTYGTYMLFKTWSMADRTIASLPAVSVVDALGAANAPDSNKTA